MRKNDRRRAEREKERLVYFTTVKILAQRLTDIFALLKCCYEYENL